MSSYKCGPWLVNCLVVLGLATHCHSQLWSGILLPVNGGGACTQLSVTAPSRCAIDWSHAGVPGGIPSANWTQSGTTIQPLGCGDGGLDCTTTIQAALNSCGTDHYVLLGAGTFFIGGSLSIPSDCALRGSGANRTVLNARGTVDRVISLGRGHIDLLQWPVIPVTAGAEAGSTRITLSNSQGLAVNGFLSIEQQNDGTFVSNKGSEGTCTWCGEQDGLYSQGQTERITAISGNTVDITPPLYADYTRSPQVVYFPIWEWTQNAGVENLQVYANRTGYNTNFGMSGCAYCWISGVEGNYADGDHVEVDWSYYGEVINSYFSNAYKHIPGGTDADLVLRSKSTGMLIQNNIFERLHTSIMLQWGASGNVIAYNYSFGNFDSSAINVVNLDIDFHGAHPQFNLFEGNIGSTMGPDSIWGSSSNNTYFRNWSRGTTLECAPYTEGTRATVTCSSSNAIWAFQASSAFSPRFLVSAMNMVGNVAGSSQQQSLVQTYSPGATLTNVMQDVAVCGDGVPTSCGPGSRSYDKADYSYSFGYGEASDSGGTGAVNHGCSGNLGYPCESLLPYKTTFMHGEYSNASNSIIWASGITHTLPASFYLSAKPSWWPSAIPFPAIGPDVTGGSGPGGYVHSPSAGNAAQNCYIGVMHGDYGGTGSPLSFNANSCYSSRIKH